MENKDNIELVSGGIVCDNPDCNWEDNAITRADYFKWINARCPKCNDVVFTEKDYDESEKMMDMVNLVNSMTPEDMNTIIEMSGLSGKSLKEQLRSSPFFKDAIGIDEIEEGKEINFSVSSLGGLKCTEIKNVENDSSNK